MTDHNPNNWPGGSHLDVLQAIGRTILVRRVLEFGCGPFSTLAFLDREIFPQLDLLQSYEQHDLWRAQTLRQTSAIPPMGRLRLSLAKTPQMLGEIAAEDLNSYDLIFIDNARDVADRIATIRAVVGRRPHPMVVIHDFETAGYEMAAAGYLAGYIDKGPIHWTAVLWYAKPTALASV